MMAPARLTNNAAGLLLPIVTAALAIVLFVVDTASTEDIDYPAFYIAVVLLAARFCDGRRLVLVSAGCAALILVSYLLSPPNVPTDEALTNLAIRISLVGVATFFTLRSKAVQVTLHEKASLLDLTHDTIFVRDVNDVITYWNHGAEELYGWTAGEAVGKVSHQLTKTVFPASLDEIKGQLLRTGRWEGELVTTRRDGTQVIVASRWALQRDPGGRPVAILETNNDITARKQASEALQVARTELAHVARMSTLGELSASVAHEVNQPLTAIVATASAALRWLDEPSPRPAEMREALTDIRNDGDRAADVIRRIRALARKAPIRTDRLDINEVILEVIALTRGELDRHHVTLRTRFVDDLPIVRGDRVQLQQVILNLIVNAMEAMQEGQHRELLITSSWDDRHNAVVSVGDSGPGLASGSVDRIFESFYTTKEGGMGMGLSICRSIIEAHGGRLTARANTPGGAVFEFALPPAS